MNMSVIAINFNSILDTALKGVRRAAVFMGLGLNAALDPAFKKYQLTGLSFVQVIPLDVNEDTIADFKQNFAIWIIGNGLRELIESFGIFLDQLYGASQHFSVSKGHTSPTDATKRQRDFTKKGLKGKLQALKDDFGITTDHTDHLCSIQKARNCLTHRLGIVAQRDCNHDSKLVVKWIGIDMMVSAKNESPVLLDLPLKEEVVVEGGGTITARFSEHELSFGIGSMIQIEPRHLGEICYFVTSEAKAFVRSALEYAKSMGISVRVDGE